MTPNAATKAKVRAVRLGCQTVDGKTYGYPVAVEAVSLIYNKDLLPNPPKTFEEIAKIDEELKKMASAPSWGLATPPLQLPWWLPTVLRIALKKTATGYDVKDTGVNNAGAKAGVGWHLRDDSSPVTWKRASTTARWTLSSTRAKWL